MDQTERQTGHRTDHQVERRDRHMHDAIGSGTEPARGTGHVRGTIRALKRLRSGPGKMDGDVDVSGVSNGRSDPEPPESMIRRLRASLKGSRSDTCTVDREIVELSKDDHDQDHPTRRDQAESERLVPTVDGDRDSDHGDIDNKPKSETKSAIAAIDLMDRRCFYCERRFRIKVETFIVCEVCYGFNACRRCWSTEGNLKGWNRVALEERQKRLITHDEGRKEERKRWIGLEQHEFTMEHANSCDPNKPMQFVELNSTCWDSSESDEEEVEDIHDDDREGDSEEKRKQQQQQQQENEEKEEKEPEKEEEKKEQDQSQPSKKRRVRFEGYEHDNSQSP